MRQTQTSRLTGRLTKGCAWRTCLVAPDLCSCVALTHRSDRLGAPRVRCGPWPLPPWHDAFAEAGVSHVCVKKDVRDWAGTCLECQRSKVHHHVKVSWHISLCPREGLTLWMWICWVPSSPPTALLTYSPWSTEPRGGRKPPRGLTSTEVAWALIGTWFAPHSNLSSSQGNFCLSPGMLDCITLGCRLCDRFHWSMKAACKLPSMAAAGLIDSPGSCLAAGPRLRKASSPHWPSWSKANPYGSLGTSSPP